MNKEPNLAAVVCSGTAAMNGRDTMPACARVAAIDPDLADRMWNSVTGDDGRDLIDERMRGKGRMLCSGAPMRLDCISRALVGGWKDKAVYGGLDYPNRSDPRPTDLPRPPHRRERTAPDPAKQGP